MTNGQWLVVIPYYKLYLHIADSSVYLINVMEYAGRIIQYSPDMNIFTLYYLISVTILLYNIDICYLYIIRYIYIKEMYI